MIQNLFKLSFRLLWRDRFFTLINLSGLAVGLAAALLIMLWVQDELTFDQQHRQGANIARVLTNWDFGGNREWTTTTPAGLGPEARAEIPEIQEVTRVWEMHTRTLSVNAALFEAKNCMIVDQSFFEVFDFELVKSDGSKPLSTPNGILITEKLAKTLFADADPLGKTLRFDDKLDLTVTGVLANPPSNSSIQFSCILPWEPVANQIVGDPKNAFHWGQMSYTTWCLMRPDADREAVAHKLAAIAARHRPTYSAFWYALQPLRQVYLDSASFIKFSGNSGDRKTILVFAIIGFLILGIACINYLNLATARASNRAKEVGIRKAVGAGKGRLFGQFLTESTLMVGMATGLGVLLALAALPIFNELSDKELAGADFFQPAVLRVVLGAAFLTLLLAGLYPAFLLTRFEPVRVLKGISALSGGNPILRKSLVTTQFVFSIALIFTALTIARQMEFFKHMKLGYEKENIFSFTTWGSKTPSSVIRTQLAGKPGIANLALSDNGFVDLGSQNGNIEWEGKDAGREVPIWQIGVDSEFPALFGLQLTDGRWFRPEMNHADSLSYIINESALREFRLEPGSAIGKWILFNGVRGTLVGVVKDFHFQSLHRPIEPLIIYQNPEWTDMFYIKTAPGKTAEAIASAKEVFENTCPGKIFKYKFIDETYDALYKTEARAGTLFNLFAGLAVLISCLGLFGLATYSASQRTKEIGVRKVLGASVSNIASLLTRDFVKLVLLACVLAMPLGWWAAQKWLSDFAYRIELQWWMFAVVGVAAITIAVLTVSFQSVRAALANPVESLRSE
ncbi:MAG: ABC transporter permease [Saprospiraceae bacterium]|nr:ABC transporter permease [Saprospiraceae bacterium]